MLLELLTYSLIPMAVLCVAAAAAARREPSPRLRSTVLHLAAGVIFAVVAVEFLPELMREDAVGTTALGFAAGTAAMLGIRSFTRRVEEASPREEARGRPLPIALLFATAVDLVVEGLVLGVAFAAGSRQGLLLTAALSIELASLGLASAASLRQRSVSNTVVTLSALGLALLFGAGALAGGLILQRLTTTVLAAFLAFGSAALLYLVAEELLTEAHEIPESPLRTSVFFLGFIALFLLEMLSR